MEILYPIYEAAKLAASIFSAAKMVKRVLYDKPRKGNNVTIHVGCEEGECTDCDIDSAMVTVGAEIFSIAKNVFRSKRPSNHAVPGLSTAFAAHRNEVRGDLVRTNASVQSIGHIVAEGLMGIRGHLVSGNSQMTYHLAGIETELEIATQAIDGVRYAVTEGLEGIRYAVHEGSTVVYKSLEEIQQMRGDIERLGQVLIDAREDCAQYFEEFSSKLDDVQMRVEKLQDAPLKHARAALREFTLGEGDLECLDKAYDYARDALFKASSPESRFNASIILVTTGYARTAKRQSPGKAKTLVAKDTFITVALELAPSLCNTSATSLDVASFMKTANGSRIVAFLLDIVSFIFLLPPANVLLTQLPRPLVEAFGILCASNPKKWINLYPEVGLTALRFFLESKSFNDLWKMLTDLEIDGSMCADGANVIQALIDSEKPLAGTSVSPRPSSDGENNDSTASGGHGYDVSGLMERVIAQSSGHSSRGRTSSDPTLTLQESHDTTGGCSYGFDELMERANDVIPCRSSTQRSRSVLPTPTFNRERNGYDIGDLMEREPV